ncbi:uncharacterized protein si:ch211-214j24.14 [Electrophorus electricus]|uniref:uncharacterized protein si:ch211-214j24.14 n=1 Tax=Electrophorus electricus TaxID=8005 RepID=UPI0015D02C37|nr:uncharacterized protein si:ch211-214j24.14 [Electrophorus electricus]
MAESWASMSVTQPKSTTTDSREMALLPQELSGRHPTTPDIIQLWQKEAGLLQREESIEEVEPELKHSWLSNKELTETTAEFDARASPVLSLEESDLEPPEAVELLMCVEEPEVEDMMEGIPQTTFTPATPILESPDFFSMPEMVSDVVHHLPYPQELPLFSMPAILTAPAPESLASSKSECADKSSVCQEFSASPTEETPLTTKSQPTSPTAWNELPVLLIAGAALVAVVIIMKYVWTKK